MSKFKKPSISKGARKHVYKVVDSVDLKFPSAIMSAPFGHAYPDLQTLLSLFPGKQELG